MSVTLFRDLPSEGFRSMELYADRLAAALHAAGCDVEQYVLPAPRLPGRANILLRYTWRMLVYPRLAARHQGRVNHVIDHTYGHLVNHLDARRTVVTCHDLRPLVLPDPSQWGVSARLWQIAFRGMLRATHIITVSDDARRELLRRSAYPQERITVVHNGIDHDNFFPRDGEEQRRVRAEYGLPDGPLVLHIGHCGPRKNVEVLLRAVARLREQGRKLTLVQGGGRFTPAQQALIVELGLVPWVRQVPYVAPGHLGALYSLADVFVFPSWYEGFGWPVLEAMACGTPVVAAAAGALAELVGDAGLLVPPGDVAAFATAIERVLQAPEFARHYVAAGLERARAFSMQRCARETMAVYERVRSASPVRA